MKGQSRQSFLISFERNILHDIFLVKLSETFHSYFYSSTTILLVYTSQPRYVSKLRSVTLDYTTRTGWTGRKHS